MSTTLPLPAAGEHLDPAADAHRYAASVRAALGDLPPDVLEELTGGLEADLGELAAESSTPLADRLGDPRGYAAELRSAAGLPERPAAGAGSAAGSGFWARTAEGVRQDRDRVLGRLRTRAWWPGAVERAHLLRPAWWVARALVGWWLLTRVTGTGGLVGLVLALAAVWVSVELGRGRWRRPWVDAAVVAGNVLAVLVLPFVLALSPQEPVHVTEYVSSDQGAFGEGGTSTGVWSDGQQVTNIYPYDAQGRPLTGVQLLDDYGRPLTTTTGGASDWSGGEPVALVPAVGAEGAPRWNAYPLLVVSDAPGAAPTSPPLPEPTLPALLGAQQPVGEAAPSSAPSSAPAAPTGPAPTGPAPTAPALGATPAAADPVLTAPSAPSAP